MKRFNIVDQGVLNEVIEANENKNTKMSHNLWGADFNAYLKDVGETKILGNL